MQRCKRLPAGYRLALWPDPKIAVAVQRIRELSPIGKLGNLDRAERGKMWRHELRVEQPETALREPRGKMHEGNFRGVRCAMKHALAEEGRAEMDAIEPARKSPAAPAFDGMDSPNVKQLPVKPPDSRIDPGFLAAAGCCGATFDDGIKIVVDPDFEPVRPHSLGEAARYNEAIKRKYAALLGIDPEQASVLGAFGHREEADGVSAEQDFGGYFEGFPWAAHSKTLGTAPGFVKPKSRMASCSGRGRLDKSVISASFAGSPAVEEFPMMVSTTNEILGFRTVRHLGIVRGITVRSRSVVGNLVGGLQSIFGGQLGA